MSFIRYYAGALTIALIVAAGCGSSDDDSGGGSSNESAADSGGETTAKTVTVGVALDRTGPVGFAGKQNLDALKLAESEINDKDIIGNGTKVKFDIQDSGSDAKQAATVTQKFVQNKDVVALIAGPGSATALSAAPIALRGKLPMDVIEAAAPGSVQLGDWIFRSSAPQNTYHARLMDYLRDKGAKTVFQVYNNDIPTNLDLGKKTWPQEASKHGLNIVQSEPIAGTATNFGSIASKIAARKPDAVMNHLNGVQIPAFIAALKRVGYEGIVAGGVGSCCGVLEPAGKSANGLTYVVSFSFAVDSSGGKAFSDLFTAKYPDVKPTLYHAGAWDAAMFVARSLKNASGDYSRASVKRGMQATADAGMPEAATGAMTFEQRDARVPGVVVKWQDGEEVAAD